METTASRNSKEQATYAEPACSRRPTSRARLFKMGDLLFLIVVGMLATLAMHLVHQAGWTMVISCLVGMVAAMTVQMVLAFCASPILGSIETMTPSMILGMISPMSICALHMIGCGSSVTLALALGAAFGIGMFVFVDLYSAKVRRLLMETHHGKWDE